VLLLEVPQGFKWVYNKISDEMEKAQLNGRSMGDEEVKQQTKEIFKESLIKSHGGKLKVL
jgi:hypothetical protein